MRSLGIKIHRSFHPLEVAADRAREGAQDSGLADAHIAFEQHVPAGKERDVDQPYRVLLADDRFADFFLQAQCAGAPIL